MGRDPCPSAGEQLGGTGLQLGVAHGSCRHDKMPTHQRKGHSNRSDQDDREYEGIAFSSAWSHEGNPAAIVVWNRLIL